MPDPLIVGAVCMHGLHACYVLMVKAGRAAESESSDEDSIVEVTRYNLLELKEALVKNGPHRLHAVQELVALFKAVYASRASKAVQQLMFNDALAAVHLLDRNRAFVNEVSQLIKVVEKLLPQQNKKRQQLLAEHKRTCLALARQAKLRHDGEDDEDDDVAWCGPSMDGLPAEVAQLILHQLDPVSLEAMASCNRQWRALALSDELWHTWSLHFFPKAAAAAASLDQQNTQPGHSSSAAQAQDSKWHHFFRLHLRGSPAVILELGAKRSLVDGRPHWRPPCSLRGLSEVQAAAKVQRAAAAATVKSTKLMSVSMVISWVLGKGVASSASDDSSSEDSSNDGCGGTDAASSARMRRQLKLWSLPRA